MARWDMVKVREDYGVNAEGKIDVDRWIEHIGRLTRLENTEELRRACDLSAEIDHQAVA